MKEELGPFYLFSFYLFMYLFIFWPCHVACEILVPPPGIEPVPPTLVAQSLNHWTAKEVPGPFSLESSQIKVRQNSFEL